MAVAFSSVAFADVDCGTLREHRSRSDEAFPTRMDKKSRLRYPIREALDRLLESCEGSVPEKTIAVAIEDAVETELEGGYRVVILAFAWCEPCKEEFSKYASFAKGQRDVTFVFVDADAHPDGLETYARERFEFGEKYELPAYAVLDTDGETLARSSGRDGLRRALNWLSKYRRERNRLLRKSEKRS
jgi:hypothetical protein